MTNLTPDRGGGNRPHSMLSESDRRILTEAMERARQRERESFLVVLQSSPGDDQRPPVARLRQLLKIALRGLGLQCLEARRSDGSAVSNG